MKLEKNFYMKNGMPAHRLSYCAFLDVLGFSARTRASYLDKTHDALLREFHEIFGELIAELKDQTTYSPLYYKSFSDNVLLAVPKYSHEMESEFGNILIATSEYQFKMALKGFFVRGGLSVGPLFVDDNSVYGEALIAAYELESKVAVNPIVVLSDDVAEIVNAHLKFYAPGVAPHRRLLLINSDGRYFINYLDECILDTYDGWELDVESLAQHRDRIQHSLAKYVEQPAVFSKFSWLASYHNYFCDTVSAAPEYLDELKVRSELMVVKFRRLEEGR